MDLRALSGPELELFRNEVQIILAGIQVEFANRRQSTALTRTDSPFDFYKYREEFKLLNNYFTGLELYLRMTRLVRYLELYQPTTAAVEIWLEQTNTRPDKRSYLEELTTGFVPEELLPWWYNHFAPEKNTPAKISAKLAKYRGREDVLFNKLYRKYVDASWNNHAPLPLHTPPVSAERRAEERRAERREERRAERREERREGSPTIEILPIPNIEEIQRREGDVSPTVIHRPNQTVSVPEVVTTRRTSRPPIDRSGPEPEIDVARLNPARGRGYMVPELQNFLRYYSLPVSGTKAQLIDRLRTFLANRPPRT